MEALKKAWEPPRGLSFITAVNNTYVGLWYVGTAFLFFILAGILLFLIYAAAGNCHVFVDASADVEMARRIASSTGDSLQPQPPARE